MVFKERVEELKKSQIQEPIYITKAAIKILSTVQKEYQFKNQDLFLKSLYQTKEIL